MLCDDCGAVSPNDAQFCWRCGGKVTYVAPPPASDPGDHAGMRMVLPVGRSLWAIVAGYLGLFAILLVPAPFAVVTGIVALREIKNDPKLHGAGRAWFGIIMGTVVMLVAGIALLSSVFG